MESRAEKERRTDERGTSAARGGLQEGNEGKRSQSSPETQAES